MAEKPAPVLAGDRLAKVMARAGLCSRRDAEEWIRAGRVTVNGAKIVTPAYNVTEKDVIAVDGTPLKARAGTRVWLYHKPRGLVVTEKDPEGRPTVFETLAQQGLPRVVSIGRLDINTEGLLLLTNDGGLKRVLELPATGWLRKYRVRAHGAITQAQLDALKSGVEVEGIKYGPIEAKLERDQGANVWLELALREGKNREVKNVLAALGLEVNRLIRISYGPFQLADIPVGAVEVVKARVLKDQLGKKLADQAEVDFDSEMPEGSAADAPRPTRKPAGPRRTEPMHREARGAPPQQRGRSGDRPERRAAFSADAGRPPRRSGPRPGAPRILFDDGREPVAYEEKTYGGKPKRVEGADRPSRGPRGDRPARTEGAERPFRAPGGDRPARTEGAERPFRAPRGDRPARAEGAGRPFRAPRGDRPARSDGAERPFRPRGDRPARPEGAERSFRGPRDDRPARSEGNDRPFRKPRQEGDARPPRRSGPPRDDASRPAGGFGKPRPARTGDDASARRPSFGKPTGKSGASRPGGRPSAGRPSAGGPRPPRGPRKPSPRT